MASDPVAVRGRVFGSALGQAERYAELLAGPGVERGLIGPAEAGRIWERHLLNCAALAELIPDGGSVADLGSGAGLPGLVLALLRPAAHVILIEAMARRVTFLEECVAELGLVQVDIVRGRAEDLAGQVGANIVTARAVAPLGRLAGWAAGLSRPGGTVLALKGASAPEEVARSRGDLRRLGITDVAVLEVGGEITGESATVVRFTVPERQARRPASGPGKRGSRSRDGVRRSVR